MVGVLELQGLIFDRGRWRSRGEDRGRFHLQLGPWRRGIVIERDPFDLMCHSGFVRMRIARGEGYEVWRRLLELLSSSHQRVLCGDDGGDGGIRIRFRDFV